jgi:hypothetical protein
MSQVGFETMISVFEQQKTVHALYRMTSAISSANPLHFLFACLGLHVMVYFNNAV